MDKKGGYQMSEAFNIFWYFVSGLWSMLAVLPFGITTVLCYILGSYCIYFVVKHLLARNL